MIVVSHSAQLVRHRGSAGAYDVRRQIARRHPEVKRKANARSKDGGENRVHHGVSKDAASFLLPAQRCQGGDHRQRDGGHGDELEKPGEYGGDEIEQIIQRLDAQPAQSPADHESQYPPDKLVPLLFVFIFLQHLLRQIFYILIFRHDCLL